jgi:NADPH-dependent 2,4-dienoyl-CoA reductase/sulfur reductase-like enzyme/rhodanese-related sulfurtransferase
MYISLQPEKIHLKYMEQIVIIGGVAAGATAAAKVRRLSADAQITMLEAGPDISFANCGLPYFIGGDIDSRSKLLLQSPESFKDQYNVDVFTRTTVKSIDRNGHLVTAVDSETGEHKTFAYTKLILAQGGRPVLPAIPGAELDHVFTLWTLEEMDRIVSHLNRKKPQSAVVIGGGFIGLEMVEALVKRGIKVRVVEMMPHVMSLMDPEIAGLITTELLTYGVEIHTGRSVREINASGVILDDGSSYESGMVLVSAGVRPALQLAKEAGLEIGPSGGLLVNQLLQTNDPDIYAAGDMIEVEHRINGGRVRIPLAGPANRQGRIVAENALGGRHEYKGALGTSVVRVFDAVAGITGFSLKQALAAGYDATSVVVHKEHHTSYYPGAEQVTVLLVFDRKSGLILGGQTAGIKGADKRLDVIATAAASQMTIHELADLDLAYSPPVGTPNDAINMAAYAAENKLTGYGPSVTVSEIDALLEDKNVLFIDVRDSFAYERGHIQGSALVPLEYLEGSIKDIPGDRLILVYDETGKKGHQALRLLKNAGIENVINISGGFMSLQRQARATGYKNLRINLQPVTIKQFGKKQVEAVSEPETAAEKVGSGPIVVDVRTRGEFGTGAVAGAVNIPLDELERRLTELGSDTARDIIVYCASGARSAYAQKMLTQLGFRNVRNGGGIMQMMRR